MSGNSQDGTGNHIELLLVAPFKEQKYSSAITALKGMVQHWQAFGWGNGNHPSSYGLCDEQKLQASPLHFREHL